MFSHLLFLVKRILSNNQEQPERTIQLNTQYNHEASLFVAIQKNASPLKDFLLATLPFFGKTFSVMG
jgi:hypothetical protein